MDNVCVSSSNMGQNLVFGIFEGHCPGGKTSSEVASMLHFSITAHPALQFTSNWSKILKLHAVNCVGQNKIQFRLFYFRWFVIIVPEEVEVLYFMVSGNNKNRCEQAFGFIKRRFRKHNFIGPTDKWISYLPVKFQTIPLLQERLRRLIGISFFQYTFKFLNHFGYPSMHNSRNEICHI